VADALTRPVRDGDRPSAGRNTAVRSQMDIRICLRVREPRDADSILGQGMTNSGWHAAKPSQPGEFVISGPEHPAPHRHRAYLLTYARRDHHVAHCAPLRPPASTQPAGHARRRRRPVLNGPQEAPDRPGDGRPPAHTRTAAARTPPRPQGGHDQ
jgi:S-DNA-T family DNA segregation ATPase FtsK/SpoIIIE